MAERKQALQTVSRLIIGLAVVAIPFAIYFYVYAEAKRDYFVSQNFRALDEVGTHLTQLFEQFEKILESSSRENVSVHDGRG